MRKHNIVSVRLLSTTVFTCWTACEMSCILQYWSKQKIFQMENYLSFFTTFHRFFLLYYFSTFTRQFSHLQT